MKKIGDFLDRFVKLAKDSDEVKILIAGYCTEAGVPVSDIKKITVRKSIVTLSLSPIQKSNLFLKQAKILASLKKDPRTAHITLVR
jgi:hypothetical protein